MDKKSNTPEIDAADQPVVSAADQPAVSAADVLKAIKGDKPKITILGEAGKDGKRKPVVKSLAADHILAWSVSGKNVTAAVADGTKVMGELG